jgi:RNA polymerase sigma factor (sigma-70 family)
MTVTFRSGLATDRQATRSLIEGWEIQVAIDQLAEINVVQRGTTPDTAVSGGAVRGVVPDDAVPVRAVDDGPAGHEHEASSGAERDLLQIVAEARAGRSAAWEALIQRFGGLVAAIARRCRLSEPDVAEVCQTTWLRLVENLDRIEQPERLGAWLATTSRRESLRIATRRTAVAASDALYLIADDQVEPLDSRLLKDEQVRAIRSAADRLSPCCQRLLGLLMGDDELPYRTIAEQLSMPIGSIGPTRGRCLERLRKILGEMELTETPA